MSAPVEYGGDIVAALLGKLGYEYIALNPGASFRGIHESLVARNDPKPILALQENICVAAAQGYGKSASKPMAVALHNLVGLQSGSMAIFNAWADQVPMLIIGGSGPSDAAVRRPWIDWLHSARSQALPVRDHLKWDDEPRSLPALFDSLLRADRIARTGPGGPTYVSVDVLLQEMAIGDTLGGRDIDSAKQPPIPVLTAPEHRLEQIVHELARAERPVIAADYVGKSLAGYTALIRIAEVLGVPVVDFQARHSFPTGHWADGTPHAKKLLAEADYVLALDMRDIRYGLTEVDHVNHSFQQVYPASATVVSISMNQLLLKGFLDYSSPTDDIEDIIADTGHCLPVMATIAEGLIPEGDRVRRRTALEARLGRWAAPAAGASNGSGGSVISDAELSRAVHDAVREGPWQIANGHLRGAVRRGWDLTEFNAHLGRNMGAGLGYGAGVSVGAALAHKGTDRIIVNLQNDGDLLYTPQGLWTAARYSLPILTVVVNNRTYGQDRMHQTLVSQARNRPVEHAKVGIDIDDPPIDFNTLAQSQGVEGFGPITTHSELTDVLTNAVRIVREERRPVLVDVLVETATA